jgi:hypothetical protein
MAQPSNEKIQKFILENNDRFTTYGMAQALNVKPIRIGGNKAALKRKGLLSVSEAKVSIDTIVNKIDNTMSAYQKKVSNGTNTYTNQNGVRKQEARNIMVNAIRTKGVILSLPCSDCTIEQQILNNSPSTKFVGCEYESETYFKMLVTIAEKKLPFVELYHGKISDKINEAKIDQYSNLILDYCGQLGTTHEDIKKAIEKDIMQVNGAMCITLNKRISFGTEYIYEKMELLNPRTSNDTDTRCEHTLRTFINRIGGLKYAIEDVFNYRDKDKANMVLMIVRRIA